MFYIGTLLRSEFKIRVTGYCLFSYFRLYIIYYILYFRLLPYLLHMYAQTRQ